MAILTKEYQKVATGPAQAFNVATGYLELWAKYNSQDIVNNATNYSVQLRLVVTDGYIGNYQSTPWSIDGNISTSGDAGSGSHISKTLGTATGTITHDEKGIKSVSMSGLFNATAWGQILTVNGSADLPTIPRTSGVACSSPYIGDTATITIDRKSTLFTDTITYKIGSLNGTIAEKTTNTVLSLDTSSIADKIYALIPNSRETEGTITCVTYNGDTQIGTSTATFSLYAKESACKPTVSGMIVDTNSKTIALTGGADKFIKYVSKPKVTVNATANKSATITGYSINLNDGQVQNVQEYTFPKISSNNVTVNAIDSRGYENPYNIDLTDRLIDYVKLHINKISLERTEEASNEVVLSLDGVWFNGKFSETTSNTLTASFKYKTSEETTWTDGGTITPTIEGNKIYAYDLSLGNIFNYQNEYQFKIIFSDLITTVGDTSGEIQVVPKGQEVVAIGEDSVWVYGNLFLNDEDLSDKIPAIKVEYSESASDSYSCDYINKDNIYSTDETKTNDIWTDGKPIYRKVCVLPNCFETGQNSFETGITNMETLVKSELHFKYNNWWYDDWGDGGLTNKIFKNNGALYEVWSSSTSTLNVQENMVIVEYTKTTD